MNEYFEKLHLQKMMRDDPELIKLRKVINKLNHKLAYSRATKRMRDNNENSYQFMVVNFH